MPKGPKGQKRPADVISNAVHVMKIATGEATDTQMPPKASKNQAAVELGRRGGTARASQLSKARRRQIAKLAAKARWK